MTKKFVLSGYFGFKNFGDEAILSVLVNKLKENNHQITIISSDPQYTSNKFNNIKSIYTFKMFDIFNAISKSDYLISGGGSLLQDATSLKSLIYYLLVIFMALLLRKKVIIFAQGIGPINNPIGQFLTKSILKHCTYLSVRDIKSYELLKSWGSDAELVCDPIFSTKIEEKEKSPVVAVQLRDYKTVTKDFIDRLAQKIVQEFPNNSVEIYSFQDSIDLERCKQLENAIKMLNPDCKTTVYNELSDEEVINNISKVEYLIAMRFHAIIVGLLSSVKTLGINYDIKVEKLAKEFDIPLLHLQKDFKNEFNKLKEQDLTRIQAQISIKNFNWDGFDRTINN